jgi:hypothetical protein
MKRFIKHSQGDHNLSEVFMKIRTVSILASCLAAILLAGMYGSALAHGQIQVGDYELEIGFHNEPAIQGQVNGLDLFVTNTKTGEMVNGLEETLKAEIIFGSSTKAVPIEPQEDLDGAYTAIVIPTQTGDYTWHIFGDIQGTPVDVSMTSSPTTFGSVEPATDYAFPSASTNPTSSGSFGLILSGIGLILGIIALLVAISALQTARRRPGV